MSKRKQISKRKRNVSDNIKDREEFTVNYDECEIVFSIKYLQTDLNNNKLQYDDMKALLNRLRLLGGLKWKEVKRSGRYKLGFEKIIEKNDAITEIVRNKDNTIKDDLNAIAFRYNGKGKPMIGFRRDNIFYIVCLNCTYPH